jgi:hypothetical protein
MPVAAARASTSTLPAFRPVFPALFIHERAVPCNFSREIECDRDEAQRGVAGEFGFYFALMVLGHLRKRHRQQDSRLTRACQYYYTLPGTHLSCIEDDDVVTMFLGIKLECALY